MTWTPEKQKAYYKEWFALNRDKVRAQRKQKYDTTKVLKGRPERLYYGITRAQRAEIIREQNGMCPICALPLPTGKNAHIDHCHTTGVVRGVLCSYCNIGLGHFKDDHRRLLRAANYVTKGKGRGKRC